MVEDKVTVPHTITLDHPITLKNEEVISEITFPRRLTAGDIVGLPGQNLMTDHYMTILTRLTGTSPAVVKRLDFVDWGKCMEVLSSFLDTSPETGLED